MHFVTFQEIDKNETETSESDATMKGKKAWLGGAKAGKGKRRNASVMILSGQAEQDEIVEKTAKYVKVRAFFSIP